MKIKTLKINGFKKFEKFEIAFNDRLSVIVGENEVGKSTILSAIDIVLNQTEFYKQDISLLRFFNTKQIDSFFSSGNKKDLPKIDIELFIDFNDSTETSHFNGLHYNDSNSKKEALSGIKFVYEFDKDFENQVDFQNLADNKVIPIEYYKSSWNTFQGKSYRRQLLRINNIFLDNSSNRHDLYGGYARQLYAATISDSIHRELSTKLKSKLNSFIDENRSVLELEKNVKRQIGFDNSKSNILKLIDIFENDISIQDMGKGRENVIKTEMALQKNNFDLILIEEPESHLSHSNTRKLIDTLSAFTDEQLIVTSHSPQIVSRLNLSNIIWISDFEAKSLSSLNSETAQYFEKIDNLDILKFILSEKVILVEGAAEYIMFEALYNKIKKTNLDSKGIEVISMGSISYNRYKEIANLLNKKVAVITDNDGNSEKIKSAKVDGEFGIFMGKQIEDWTLETAFYSLNKEFFDTLYKDVKTKDEYNGINCPKALAHMLKNKTANAMEIEKNIDKLEIPDYLVEAINWISE